MKLTGLARRSFVRVTLPLTVAAAGIFGAASALVPATASASASACHSAIGVQSCAGVVGTKNYVSAARAGVQLPQYTSVSGRFHLYGVGFSAAGWYSGMRTFSSGFWGANEWGPYVNIDRTVKTGYLCAQWQDHTSGTWKYYAAQCEWISS